MNARIRPAHYRDTIEIALELRSQGRLREALDALSNPGDFSADFYVLRGDLQMEAGQIEEAAASYSTVTAAEPEHMYAQSNLGSCLRRLERWEDAVKAFQSVLDHDPHRDFVRLELGECLLRLNRFEEALWYFDRCWSEGARRRALFGAAVALQLLRRFDEAEVCYERLLILDPTAEESLSNLISMSMEVFDLERVKWYARQLLDVNARAVSALQGMALVSIERHDYRSAAHYLGIAAEELSETPPAPQPGDESSIEYRLSGKAIGAIKEARQTRPMARAQAAGGSLVRT